MQTMPRDSLLDSTFALQADPYGFISKRCRLFRSELFEARIMLRRTICMTGSQAAELFYDSQFFQHTEAAPEPLHAIGPDAVEALAERVRAQWLEEAAQWTPDSTVVLYDAAQKVLTRAVCEWSGVPLAEHEEDRRMHDLMPLFDSAARGGLNPLRARWARQRAEHWLTGVLKAVRSCDLSPPTDSVLMEVAERRDADGAFLTPRAAAVELLGVLCPMVATSAYVVFAAHALQLNPRYRAELQFGDRKAMRCFLQEVQRHYPFFPAVVARVLHDFEWNGFHFTKGRRAMLDLYGTNHDPSTWQAPERFRPERFRERRSGAFAFVSPGGSGAASAHQGPGESVAAALMAVSVDFLVNQLAYEVVPQDLRIDQHRLPALPRSRFVIKVHGLRD
jgi:fatty-acid peroxygenase